MSIEDEIAQVLVDTGLLKYPGDRHTLTAAVMPLVKRAQAEARAAELRDIADEFVDQAFMGWPHNVDVREAAEHFEGMVLKRAGRIENEGAGA